MRPKVWIGWFSSAVEAYNISIYSFAAPQLSSLLFVDSANATLYSYALLLLGSLCYPLGAAYYGVMADRLGRADACFYSSLGLALSTASIAFFPQNHWLYLLSFICAQHFFSGGEYHGSALFSVEHADQKGLASGCSCFAAVLGLVCASGLSAIAYKNILLLRGCFLLGGVGGALGYLFKGSSNISPPASFTMPPLPPMVKTTALLTFFLTSYYFLFLFLPLVDPVGLYLPTWAILLLYGALLLLSGFLADRVGAEKMVKSGLSLFLGSIIAWMACPEKSGLMQPLLIFCLSLVIGPIHAWTAQQFSSHQRCGIFFSSAVATVCSATTLPISLFLYKKTGSIVICSLYPASTALLSLFCLLSARFRLLPASLPEGER